MRTGDTEPSPAAVRTATADVIEHCVYGVDLNDLAIEITKVALWLEAFDADRPFPFLDAHFRVGNALLGTTPALLRDNIPDTAFVVLGDDDKDWTAKLKARNKAEREADADQLTLDFGPETLNVETAQFTKAAREADAGTAGTLARMRARADAWRALEADPDLIAAKRRRRRLVRRLRPAEESAGPGSATSGQGITHATLRNLSENPDAVPGHRHRTDRRPRPPIPVLPLALGVSRHLHRARRRQRRPRHRVERRILLRHRQPAVGTRARSRTRSSSATSAAPTSKAPPTAAIRKKMIEELADTDPAPLSSSTEMRCGNPTAPRTCCSRAAAIRSPARATSTPTASSPKPCAPSPARPAPPASSPPPAWPPTRPPPRSSPTP